MKHFLLLGIAFVSWAMPTSSFATILDVGAQVFDTRSHLIWLDLDESTGVSYDEMETLLGTASSKYSGFRFATYDEVAGLFDHAGIEKPGELDAENISGALNLLSTMGYTYCARTRGTVEAGNCTSADLPGLSAFRIAGMGMFLRTVGTDAPIASYLLDYNLTFPGQGLLGYGAIDGNATPSVAFEHIGHFLVREVPEPSTVSLFCLALTGLWIGKRTRRPHIRRRFGMTFSARIANSI